MHIHLLGSSRHKGNEVIVHAPPMETEKGEEAPYSMTVPRRRKGVMILIASALLS